MASPDLSALLVNCTLKASPATSNTGALLDKVAGLLGEGGVATDSVRLADLHLPPGVETKALDDRDDFPSLYEKMKAVDILVVGSPIWLGKRSSLCQRLLERMDGSMSETDDLGRMPFHGKVAACVVTGNEDGAHEICSGVLFNLTHMGYTIPPLADCYWVGPAGPGPDYLDADGERHLYTNKTARYVAAGTAALAKALKATPYEIDYNALTKQAESESDTEE